MKKQKIGTPRLATWLLQHIADPDDALSLTGDVEEDYKDICSQRGNLKAKCWALHQVLISLPPFFKSYIYWSVTMIKNYLKIAFRVIKKHKGYSFINITGLAVGIACCVLILLWVQNELSFNKFHKNYKEIYRTALNLEGQWTTSSPWALAPILKREYPEILMATRYRNNDLLFTYEDKSFNEETAFVDCCYRYHKKCSSEFHLNLRHPCSCKTFRRGKTQQLGARIQHLYTFAEKLLTRCTAGENCGHHHGIR